MLCILAKIDDGDMEELLKMQRIAESFGLKPKKLHGHVTLACYIGDDEEKFISSCKEKTVDICCFKVYYDKIDIFDVTHIIVAEPRKEAQIELVHKDISCSWSDDLNSWTRDNVWLPHTTLVQDSEADLETVAEAMRREFKPFAATVTELEFSRVTGNQYEIIDSIILNKKSGTV